VANEGNNMLREFLEKDSTVIGYRALIMLIFLSLFNTPLYIWGFYTICVGTAFIRQREKTK